MGIKKVWTTMTGHWHGEEVHDKEILAKYVLYTLAMAFLIGLVVGTPTCHKQPTPAHIQTSGS